MYVEFEVLFNVDASCQNVNTFALDPFIEADTELNTQMLRARSTITSSLDLNKVSLIEL